MNHATLMCETFIITNTYSQVTKICENECIGFNVTNRGSRTLWIEKAGQSVAALSVWATVRMEDNPGRNPY